LLEAKGLFCAISQAILRPFKSLVVNCEIGVILDNLYMLNILLYFLFFHFKIAILCPRF
jgi:hypothetical protein